MYNLQTCSNLLDLLSEPMFLDQTSIRISGSDDFIFMHAVVMLIQLIPVDKTYFCKKSLLQKTTNYAHLHIHECVQNEYIKYFFKLDDSVSHQRVMYLLVVVKHFLNRFSGNIEPNFCSQISL